jgi:hypothetical protein
MASIEIAQEILKILSLEDSETLKAITHQIPQFARHFELSEEEVPAKFREMLKDLEVSYGSKGFQKYLKERADWLKENKDLLMLTYDIETNWKFSKIRRGGI